MWKEIECMPKQKGLKHPLQESEVEVIGLAGIKQMIHREAAKSTKECIL